MAGLGSYGYVWLERFVYEQCETAVFERRVGSGSDEAVAGEAIGEMAIPRLGMRAVILEGADEGALRRGIGHIPGTALPSGTGNIGLAGHRDTVFRALRNIREADIILLTGLGGTSEYRVEWTSRVGPEDVSVLRQRKKAELTLVTCYPFYYVGPAPERFVVRASRIGEVYKAGEAQGVQNRDEKGGASSGRNHRYLY
ncbi:MAG: class D sortase [Bryobacterales bacterium]|nr:class D sortase [Bryobacterales bacterium]